MYEPGSVTERAHFYAAPYTAADPQAGGGLADDAEDIEALELDFDDARAMSADGRIADAKAIARGRARHCAVDAAQ